VWDRDHEIVKRKKTKQKHMIFNSRRIENLEAETQSLSRLVDRLFYELDELFEEILAVKKSVSPAKAPKKHGKTILTDGAGGSFVGKGQSSRIYEVGTIPSPAKAPKKRGRPAKKVTTKKK